MNTTDARVDHTKPAPTTSNLISMLENIHEKTVHTIADNVKGNTQYPRIQTDWKNEIVPPNSCALIVTAAAPAHTMTNTAANTAEK